MRTNESAKVRAGAGRAKAVTRIALARAERAETALRQIRDAKQDWHINVGSYAGGETDYGFSRRLQEIARVALAAQEGEHG